MGYGGQLSGVFDYMPNLSFEVVSEATHGLPLPITCVELRSRNLFQETYSLMEAKMREHSPRLIIIAGVFHGASYFHLEKGGRNSYDPATYLGHPENTTGHRLIEDAADVYQTTLPIESICQQLRSEKRPVTASSDAGLQGCNAAIYGALHINENLGLKAGITFLHLPYTEEQSLARYERSSEETPWVDFGTQRQVTKRIIELTANYMS